jgi:hypothetical protein
MRLRRGRLLTAADPVGEELEEVEEELEEGVWADV